MDVVNLYGATMWSYKCPSPNRSRNIYSLIARLSEGFDRFICDIEHKDVLHLLSGFCTEHSENHGGS